MLAIGPARNQSTVRILTSGDTASIVAAVKGLYRNDVQIHVIPPGGDFEGGPIVLFNSLFYGKGTRGP